MERNRFDPKPVLKGLKDFQLRTVNHAFKQLYSNNTSRRRFLVADEVGLGKTMVARGVIARTLEHLHGKVDRIDIVYVCSNAAIAEQNVRRLNVLGDEGFSVATRLTLLPTQVHDLSKRPINFVSFTPGTSFDLKSRCGRMDERIVIFKMLEQAELGHHPRGLSNLLRDSVMPENWKWYIQNWDERLDPVIHKKFIGEIHKNRSLQNNLKQLSEYFSDRRRRIAWEHQDARLGLIEQLRRTLARVCIVALKPDLVILDEFQRFRELLGDECEAARLAQVLFCYEGVRVLLLSATPYKMLSLDHEKEDDHYPDFLKTLEFLYNDSDAIKVIERDIVRYRKALYAVGEEGTDPVIAARRNLERNLRRVMCRTERVAVTCTRDAMLVEPRRPATVAPSDLRQARLVDSLARAVSAPDSLEYWKSSPYALSFLRHYKVRENLVERAKRPPPAVLDAFKRDAGSLLDRKSLDNYEELDPLNGRMRCLFSDTFDRGLWKLLWMPPSMPYSEPAGVFRNIGSVTKSLVFSSWSLVPDAIATVCSYEAERRMIAGLGRRRQLEREKLHEEITPLLQFAREAEGRLTGMNALARLYPSPSLATLVDPLALALEHGNGMPLPRSLLLNLAEEKLRPEVRRIASSYPRTGRKDERWYWALPILLDAEMWQEAVAWCRDREEDGWIATAAEDESGIHFPEHVEYFVAAAENRLDPPLGRVPSDLVRVVAELALGGPGVCVLRALRRVVPPEFPAVDFAMLSAAAHGASGFRTLFNMPESIGLLRGRDSKTPYWRRALQYSIDGNMQALLDEQVHVLQEALGLISASPSQRVKETADTLARSLSIRTAQVRVDEYQVNEDRGQVVCRDFNVRSRFALRFGELKDDKDQTLARADVVRTAFNSPFRPFILASTSVGQEGLDFHTWCHAVMHWNLPSNPVDLEQREGRVHRFKGHAVRKNLAEAYGLQALCQLAEIPSDPWKAMFDLAVKDRSNGTSDLVPYWIFEGGETRVERRVPLIPYSREVGQLARLKRGLALYRLVFGQPRQEDLLGFLNDKLPEEDVERIVEEWKIDLSP